MLPQITFNVWLYFNLILPLPSSGGNFSATHLSNTLMSVCVPQQSVKEKIICLFTSLSILVKHNVTWWREAVIIWTIWSAWLYSICWLNCSYPTTIASLPSNEISVVYKDISLRTDEQGFHFFKLQWKDIHTCIRYVYISVHVYASFSVMKYGSKLKIHTSFSDVGQIFIYLDVVGFYVWS